MNAVDTNILFYAHDPRDPLKRQVADRLIASLSEGVLLWQVSCEFLYASRKLAVHGFDPSAAFRFIDALRRSWATSLPDWDTLQDVERLRTRYSIQFWDALLLASCRAAGVNRLYSEDFGNPAPRVEDVEIVNPFTP
ncbi:MAG: PIN domain-containing protein [Planctomycetes bacterium]|nr:PIN domain-containing protein [Planctomycetota bacterium]